MCHHTQTCAFFLKAADNQRQGFRQAENQLSCTQVASRRFPVKRCLKIAPPSHALAITYRPQATSPPKVFGRGHPSAQVHPLLKLVHRAFALGNFVRVSTWWKAPPVSPSVPIMRWESRAPWSAWGAILPAIGLSRLLPTSWDPRAIGVRAARL